MLVKTQLKSLACSRYWDIESFKNSTGPGCEPPQRFGKVIFSRIELVKEFIFIFLVEWGPNCQPLP